MESGCPLLFSQDPIAGSYPESVYICPHPSSFKMHFNIIRPSSHRFPFRRVHLERKKKAGLQRPFTVSFIVVLLIRGDCIIWNVMCSQNKSAVITFVCPGGDSQFCLSYFEFPVTAALYGLISVVMLDRSNVLFTKYFLVNSLH
jgi:hypothetical protein